jgi:hypothetical protein
MKLWKIIVITILSIALWTFIICFPNPYIFARNISRYLRLPIDPSVVHIIETEIPDKPADIERFVMKLVEYEYDWENYGYPDYVATARQSVISRKGDCEDRAIVFASILESKKIPYNLRASVVHYWVDYAGKRRTRSENEDVSFFGKVDGKYKLKMPDTSQWQRYMESGKKGAWDAMPAYRKLMMISGWAFILLFGCYLVIRKRINPID